MRSGVKHGICSTKMLRFRLSRRYGLGKLKKKAFAIIVISFITICYIMKVTVINTVEVDGRTRTTLHSSTRGLQCSSTLRQTNASVTRKDWDFRLFERPQFLKNFKNPCFFQNISMRVDGTVTGQFRLRCLPYFIIAGFPKAGTTDLWFRLMSHPDIRLRHIKEPRFFNIGRYTQGGFNYAAAKYLTFFDKAAAELHRLVAPLECQEHPFPYYHGITGEGTVDTVFDNKLWHLVPGNDHCKEPVVTNADYVYHINPDVKIIFMVRNPVERLYSDYLYEARFVHYPVSRQLFHEAVTDAIQNHTDCRKHTSVRACAYNGTLETFKIRLRVGMYNIFIADWLKVFPHRNILVVKSEDTTGPKKSETYRRIFEFLNIRPFTKLEEVAIFHRSAVNTRSAGERELGDMLPETRTLVEKFYEPFNKELTKMYPDINYNNK
ncbi:carbohydrate sulfotransferase 15-like [Mercenaria mercenaria]|uniref:carbohydrate sulfotransferase 15-like n=1 Tax=Mercenaria mercenaria TaxID=6596 RepID=UPI00234F1A33|nr:carbohydrate sulfotransferase 15-like [Mercenaria mercenaria]